MVLFRRLEKMLGLQHTCDQIIHGLRSMKFLKVENTDYLPAYARTAFTDDLHSVFGFGLTTKSSLVKKFVQLSATRRKNSHRTTFRGSYREP